MLESEERTQVLTDLGLSSLEAKIYLSLAKIGEATAKTISKATKISQPDVYRVVSKLENVGLIERIIALPNRFKATLIEEGIAMLLQRRDNQSVLLHKQASELIENLKGRQESLAISSEDRSQFILVPGIHINKIRNSVDSAKEEVQCVTMLEMFRKIRFVHEDVWKRGVKRKVNYKFIIGKPCKGKVKLELDSDLNNNPFFNVRFIVASMPCIILVDKKEVFLRTELNIESPLLWSNNPYIVAMIYEYFMTLWKNETDPAYCLNLNK